MIVVEAELAVFEEAPQRELVADGVAQRSVHEAAFRLLRELALGPGEEGVDQRTHGRLACTSALRRRQRREAAIDVVDVRDQTQALRARGVLADRGVPELPSRMRLISCSG